MDNTTYYQKNKEKLINKVKECYSNDKKKSKRASKK